MNKRFYKKKPKKVVKDTPTTSESYKNALRAFLSPDFYPFALDWYKENGKTEKALQEDIKNATEHYNILCGVVEDTEEDPTSVVQHVVVFDPDNPTAMFE